MMIVPPNANRPIIDENGQMEKSFRTWTRNVSKLGIIRGTGSPVGFVSGDEDQLYYDINGGPGSNLYIKKFAEVGGDTTQGWELT